MSINFKLKYDNCTRRIAFDHNPNWGELLGKIVDFYSIPADHVGVTYVDTENEEITLNTDEELQDYFRYALIPGEVIKFTVRNLRGRSQIRNTFGQFVDVDIPGADDWQPINNIPSLEEILALSSTPASETRSAYIESVSGRSVTGKDRSAVGSIFGQDDAASQTTERAPATDKGKGRAKPITSFSSTQSIVAEDNADKPPVHVYDVSSQKHTWASLAKITLGAAESTPKSPPLDIKSERGTENNRETFDDPPLPTFDTPPAQDRSIPPSVSLAHDVSNFLTTLSGIVSSHPELSESLRSIMHNTTNGTYWTAHREAVSKAAAEFHRSTEALTEQGRRTIEEQAGRRVTEALAGVLRTFSQVQAATGIGNTNPSTGGNVVSDSNTQEQKLDESSIPPPSGPPLRGNFPFDSQQLWRTLPSVATAVTGALNVVNSAAANPFTTPTVPVQDTDRSRPAAPGHLEPSTSNSNEERSEYLKARVAEAKRVYQLEKDRYRQQKEESRKEKEKQQGVDPNGPQKASNARDGFPGFEIINVTGSAPQRHNTHHGHFPRRHERVADDLFTRAVNRITKRLTDMGFTERAYPDLPEKIKGLLPSDGAIAKDCEDDIVTTLLEGLLAVPKTPVASGSSVPGGWH